jgi:tRNA pseudouridine38-40 synthase
MALRLPCWSWLTRRIKLVVAYDGTDFCGWAASAGRRTIQSTLTEAVRRVSGEDCEIVGASRTDSGAHARGQVCHFESNVPIPAEKWAGALNRILPADVAVRSSNVVSERFHSRFCAESRFYRYRIAVGPRDPLRARYVYTHWEPLDVAAMKVAACALVGEHDYRAYTEELDPRLTNTVRRMHEVTVKAVRDEIWIDVRGTAFLRGMMRRMAGALFEVGRALRRPESLAQMLTEEWSRMHLPVVLPACGLTLMSIRYGRHPVDNRERPRVEERLENETELTE